MPAEEDRKVGRIGREVRGAMSKCRTDPDISGHQEGQDGHLPEEQGDVSIAWQVDPRRPVRRCVALTHGEADRLLTRGWASACQATRRQARLS